MTINIFTIFLLLAVIVFVVLLINWEKEQFWGGTPMPYMGQPLEKWGRYAVQAQTQQPVLMIDKCAKCINLPCPNV